VQDQERNAKHKRDYYERKGRNKKKSSYWYVSCVWDKNVQDSGESINFFPEGNF
jgi:hypothetical protein